MSLDNITSITDIADAIKALSEKASALESGQSACQGEESGLNRVKSRLLADNTKPEQQVRQLESGIEKLGGRRVEKDGTDAGMPPSRQSIAAQAALRTRSLREPSGRTGGGQQGHEGHELAKTDSPSITEEHRAKVCPHCGGVIGEDTRQACTLTTQVMEVGGVMVAPSSREHKRLTAVCPRCHRKVHGRLPTGNSTKTSYGSKVQTIAI